MSATHLWNPRTTKLVAKFIARPSHALLITGPVGSGKYTLAQTVARQLLAASEDQDLQLHPAIKQPLPLDAPSIPIEFIRELRDFTKLKSAGTKTIGRVILVPNAERMQIAAANALLKLLEEPPADTVIILTAPSEKVLLPTIVSRTQQLRTMAPELSEVMQHFGAEGFEAAAIQRLYMLSNGRIGLLAALLHEDESHPLAKSVLLAKEILQASQYDRLTKVDELAKDKTSLAVLLDALEQILRAAMSQAATATKLPALQKLHSSLKEVLYAKELLRNNAMSKLVLDNLFLSI